jgi:hypothetical protein
MDMESKNGCPFCQENIIDIVQSTPPAMQGLQVQCDSCGARGPIYESKEEAIAGWEFGIIGLEGRMRKS